MIFESDRCGNRAASIGPITLNLSPLVLTCAVGRYGVRVMAGQLVVQLGRRVYVAERYA